MACALQTARRCGARSTDRISRSARGVQQLPSRRQLPAQGSPRHPRRALSSCCRTGAGGPLLSCARESGSTVRHRRRIYTINPTDAFALLRSGTVFRDSSARSRAACARQRHCAARRSTCPPGGVAGAAPRGKSPNARAGARRKGLREVVRRGVSPQPRVDCTAQCVHARPIIPIAARMTVSPASMKFLVEAVINAPASLGDTCSPVILG